MAGFNLPYNTTVSFCMRAQSYGARERAEVQRPSTRLVSLSDFSRGSLDTFIASY